MSVDILIAGGGISGLSSAWFLAKKGMKVALIDRGRIGAESSWAGGGILFPLLPWNYPESVTGLCRAGWEAYPQWAAQLQQESGIDPEYCRSGMRVFHADDVAAEKWCRDHYFPMEKSGDGSFRLPAVSQVRNPRLVQALVGALEAMGVSIMENVEAVSLFTKSSRVDSIATACGKKLRAEKFLLTAGAWSAKFLGSNACALDIHPVKGQMLLFKGKPGLLDSIYFSDGLYLIPRLDGHILVGSTLEDSGFDKATSADVKNSLCARAFALFPQLEKTQFVRHWAGLRPGSPGNIPTVSRHPEIENLYLNAGHFRYGVTMAPATAAMATKLIMGDEAQAAPYRWPQ